MYGSHVLLNRSILPGVYLECRVSHLQALLGKIGVSPGTVKPFGVAISRIGAGIAGKACSVRAQKLVDGSFIELARQVPQGYVHLAHPHTGVLTQGLLGIVVYRLPVQGAPSYQGVGEHR
ncbi:hypothetical protein ES703_97874 [subsurface metagenome]